MKRIFTFGLMLAGAFALTNCAKELIDPTMMPEEITQETATPEKEGIPFQIYASLDNVAETKTVGEKDGTRLKTKWDADDKIHVYCQELGGAITYVSLVGFADNATEDDIEEGLFSGMLPGSFNPALTYNWYFVYGGSGHADGNTSITIDIPTNQTQNAGNDVTHIGELNCPMWGKAVNISGKVTPRVQMTHLAALHELKITNLETETNSVSGATAGPIVVRNIGMNVRSTGTWISKRGGKQQALAGGFQLDIINGTLTELSDNTNYEITLTLNEPATITPGGISSFYFVTAPLNINTARENDADYYEHIADPTNVIDKATYNNYDATNKSNYTPANKRQDIFTFKVNGASRTVAAQKEYNFRSSQVWRYTLPIYVMTHPLASDAIGAKATNTPGTPLLLTIPMPESQQTATINGHPNVNIYTISDGESLLIDGNASDLIAALDAGFYATSWNNKRSAMTVSRINLWFPEFNSDGSFKKHTQFASYKGVEDAIKNILANDLGLGSFIAGLAWAAAGWMVTSSMTNGISRDEGLIPLSKVIDPQTLSFNGLIENGSDGIGQNNNYDITILMEEDAHKNVNSVTINNLLKSKFSYTDEAGDLGTPNAVIVPDLDGLLQIVNGNAAVGTHGHNTAHAIYYGLINALGGRSMDFGGREINLVAFVQKIIPDVASLKRMLPHMRFAIEIIPYPYAEDKKAYGSKGNPVKPSGDTNPIVMWGIDILGPNKSPANN